MVHGKFCERQKSKGTGKECLLNSANMDLKYCVEVPTDLVQQETQTDLETEFPSTLATKCCESKNSCTSSTNTAASLDGATFIGGAVDVSTEVNFKDVYGSAFFWY